MKKIEMIVEETKTGYSAYARKYPVGTTGDTFAELKHNILEVMNFYFDEMEGKGRSILERDVYFTIE